MSENACLSRSIGQIDLGFVEREATPRLLPKLSIQLDLAKQSLLNTVSLLEVFGVERARSAVHNWVHKTDLRPAEGRSRDQIAVNEIVIQPNDEKYWLSAAVDPQTNDLLHTKLEPTTTKVLAHSFLAELSEKHDVDDVPRTAGGSRGHARRLCVLRTLCFLSMVRTRYKMRAIGTALISDTHATEIGTLSNVSSKK